VSSAICDSAIRIYCMDNHVKQRYILVVCTLKYLFTHLSPPFILACTGSSLSSFVAMKVTSAPSMHSSGYSYDELFLNMSCALEVRLGRLVTESLERVLLRLCDESSAVVANSFVFVIAEKRTEKQTTQEYHITVSIVKSRPGLFPWC